MTLRNDLGVFRLLLCNRKRQKGHSALRSIPLLRVARVQGR